MGFLLSGGLDSSLVVGAARKLCLQGLGPESIRTFSVCFQQGYPSSDVTAALKVVHELDLRQHTVVSFSFEEALFYLGRVIESIEYYDCTTVRASVPMWLLAKYVHIDVSI